ncbi:hypothetical protein ACN20G_37150 (plasmid) [Streptomyces sp. BI20]|uniref:hypothetical protein n=1 Tax=Streptomyces sp. BI20 TaxID=3403460 RepID=UPI003C7252EC
MTTVDTTDWNRNNDGTSKTSLGSALSYDTVRRVLAGHEAAHALVLLALGTPVVRTGVVDLPAAPGLEWEITGGTKFEPGPMVGLDFVGYHAAGEVGGARILDQLGITGPAADALTSHHDDYATAAATVVKHGHTLPRTGPGLTWEAARLHADLILAAHADGFHDLTEAIVRGGVITGAEAAAAARIPTPPRSR